MGGWRAFRCGTVVAAVAVQVLLVATPARAYTQIVYAIPTTMTELPAGQEGTVRAVLRLSGLDAGEVHNLRSEITVGYPNGRIAVGHKITCAPVGGSTVQQVWNGRNLLVGETSVTLMARMLFIAPAAGDYDCYLRAYVQTLSPTPAQARLLSGFIGDIRGAISGPVAQLISNESVNRFFDGGSSQQFNIISGYQPAAGATTLNVVGDVYLTSCYSTGGNACPAGDYPPSGSAIAYTRVVATPASPSCAAVASTPITSTVSSEVHHLRVNQQISVPTSDGCGTWTIDLYARHAGGLPFVVNTSGPYTYTYVYATAP
jgi:hypothetical protein